MIVARSSGPVIARRACTTSSGVDSPARLSSPSPSASMTQTVPSVGVPARTDSTSSLCAVVSTTAARQPASLMIHSTCSALDVS